MSQKISVDAISDYKVEEAIRRVSINISNSYPDAKKILVSSVAGKEGKSFVSLQLARILGARGSKVLYIDGDLRSGLSSETGLAEYMEGKAKAESIVCETNCKNLSVIPAGKQQVMIDEVLLEKLLKGLEDAYEYIIMDTPSLGEVADGILSGKFCDGVLLVVEPEIVTEKRIRTVKTELERNGCKILGVVLNKVM